MTLLRSRMFVAAIAFVMPVVAQAQDSPQRKELRRVDLSGAAGIEVVSSISNSGLAMSFPGTSITALRRGMLFREQWCRIPGNRLRCLQPVRRSSIFAMWCMAASR